jgi:hypothetical protein
MIDDALSSDRVQTALDVVLQWDYASGPDSLARLYARAAETQWIAHRDLDWDAPHDVDQVSTWGEEMAIVARTSYWRGLDPAIVAGFQKRLAFVHLSNFLHGEQAALAVAGQLVGAVPEMRAKLYAASQTMDEARHVDAFSRYLARFGKPLPPSRAVRLVIDRTLAASDWLQKLVGMQIVVEGLALFRFREMLIHNREPLLQQLLTYVARDEARHHAYGITYLQAMVPGLSPAARAELEDFVFETVRTFIAPENQNALEMFLASGIDFAALAASYAREEASIVESHGRSAKFEPVRAFVLPALQRVGLLSDRLAERFYELLPGRSLSGNTLAEFLGMVAELASAEAAAESMAGTP